MNAKSVFEATILSHAGLQHRCLPIPQACLCALDQKSVEQFLVFFLECLEQCFELGYVESTLLYILYHQCCRVKSESDLAICVGLFLCDNDLALH